MRNAQRAMPDEGVGKGIQYLQSAIFNPQSRNGVGGGIRNLQSAIRNQETGWVGEFVIFNL
jgi:hypothetical protein